MRDIESIDAALRPLSRAWRAARVVCDQMLSTELIDRLLAERAAAECQGEASPPRARRDLQRPPSAACRFLNELHARGESELGVDVGEVGLHSAR